MQWGPQMPEPVRYSMDRRRIYEAFYAYYKDCSTTERIRGELPPQLPLLVFTPHDAHTLVVFHKMM